MMRIGILLSTVLLLACSKTADREFTYSILSSLSSNIYRNGDAIHIEVQVSDHVEATEFYLDRVLIGTSLENTKLTWTPQELSGGDHTLTVKIFPLEFDPVSIDIPLLFEYVVGERTQGGIVFSLDETHTHGMAAALSDLVHKEFSEFAWGPEIFIGATDSANGHINTSVLSNSALMESNIWVDFKFGYSFGGYNDWYVGSRKEMLLLFDFVTHHQNELLINKTYWTSTECCRANACAVDFTSGTAITCLKADSLFSIRPIRKF